MSRRSNRRILTAASVLAGLALGFVTFGRSTLAIVCAALAAIVGLVWQLSRGER